MVSDYDKTGFEYNVSECETFYSNKIKQLSRYAGNQHYDDYYILILGFIRYIYETADKKLKFVGYDPILCKTVENIVDYNHRWSNAYVNRMLARLYNLDLNNIIDVTMLTMTTYHDSDYAYKKTGKRYSIYDSFVLLLESRSKLIQLLRNIEPGINYLWILEPHKSGYPHCHMIIFSKLTPSEKIHLKRMWSQKYNAGTYINGLDIKDVKNIRSIRNYLMKYFRKSIMHIDLKSCEVSLGLLAYHSVAKEYGFRFIGCSKNVSSAMNPEKSENDKKQVIWYKVTVLIKNDMWDENSTDEFQCSISQEKYELALEKLEETKKIYAGLSVLFG